MKTLRWGLLGTARINRSLIPPLKASPRNTLVGVASRDLARAEAYARAWEIPRAYGSYEALLADAGIDVVYIPLPNHLHAAWAVRAAQAGKHVLCEKPLALTVADVEAMAAAAEAAGVVLAEAFMYRHHPRTLHVRTLLDEGAIGTVRLVRGSFSFNLTRPETDIRWDPARGGGALWDVGCYPLSYTRFVLGAEPVEVFGHRVSGPTGVDLTFCGQLRFQGGVLAQIDASFQAQYRMAMEVVGTEGAIWMPRAFKPEADMPFLLTRGDAAAVPLTSPDEPAHLYAGEVEDLADAVLEGRPPRVSIAESCANVAVIEALHRSAREGRPVAL